jgi:hypothetical protein
LILLSSGNNTIIRSTNCSWTILCCWWRRRRTKTRLVQVGVRRTCEFVQFVCFGQ